MRTENQDLPVDLLGDNSERAARIICQLVRHCPGVLRQPNKKGDLPLHSVLESRFQGRAGSHYVQFLVNGYPQAVAIPNRNNELPIQLACQFGGTVEVIQILLDGYKRLALNRNCLAIPDRHGSTTLHIAVSGRGAQVDAVQLLVRKYPQALQTRNNFGRLPLHEVCVFASTQSCGILRVLLQAHLFAVFQKQNTGLTPLQLMFRNGHLGFPIATRRLLLEKQNEAVEQLFSLLDQVMHGVPREVVSLTWKFVMAPPWTPTEAQMRRHW